MTKSTTIPLYKRNLTIIPTPASLNVSPDRVLRLQAVEIILCTELCDTRVEHNDEQINNGAIAVFVGGCLPVRR